MLFCSWGKTVQITEQSAPTKTPLANRVSIHQLKGVGPRTFENLAQLGIQSVQDLLFHLPSRYQDRTQITPMRLLQDGQFALIEGEVFQAQLLRGRKPSLKCQLIDGSSYVSLRFFHFNAQQLERFKKPGFKLRCFGEVRAIPRRGFEMIHPEIQEVKLGDALVLNATLTPIYPTTKGLQQRVIRKLMQQALEAVAQGKISLDEYLPQAILDEFNFPSLGEALHFLHSPPSTVNQLQMLSGRHPMQQRLAFEELLAQQLACLELRSKQKSYSGTALIETHLQERLLQSLPFRLTAAQQRVLKEIQADLSEARPMLRLVQGDVGSGKTIIAALAILQAVASGFQSALMAPTELLAEQHCQSLRPWFEPLGIRVAVLSSGLPRVKRQEVLADLASGELLVVVGTHALIQSDVEFAKLKLLIIDEQHRFGVEHRLALKEKGGQFEVQPHQLIMTATPIPRTLAMSAYADLDSSIIDELPPGRQSITSALVSNARRAEVVARLQEHSAEGRQAYWVCTLIAESEVLQCQAAEVTLLQLQALLPNLRMALMHGRLSSEEKEGIMKSFKAGEIDLLVATTVIEVGVDVPNASLMVIENSERLGLAQLHQLRGRVGRGSEKSYCIFLYQHPLSVQARKRLSIMRASQNGFIIAEQDLEMRGPGEVLGTRQAGLANLRVADLLRDKDLLPTIVRVAELMQAQHAHQTPQLIARWLSLKTQYAQV